MQQQRYNNPNGRHNNMLLCQSMRGCKDTVALVQHIWPHSDLERFIQ